MDQAKQTNGAGHTHKAIVGTEELLFSFDGTDSWKEGVDALVKKHGGVPRIEAQSKPEPDDAFDAMAREMPGEVLGIPMSNLDVSAVREGGSMAFTVRVPPAIVRGQTVVASGRDRSAADEALARSNGFAPKQPLYARGTAVIDMGVDNAREKRAEFDAMPSAADACEAIVEQVADEDRADATFEIASLRMRKSGLLTTVGGSPNLSIGAPAFADLMVRVGPGGGAYLAKCEPELRAINLNRWAVRVGEEDEQARDDAELRARASGKPFAWEPTKAVLRTRRNEKLDAREVFAVVSEGYTPFDVDRIASALRLAAPADARGAVKYDGTRASFDVLFHSDVKPEEYVAGEFFRAGVRVRTDDTGGGGIKVSAIVWQNLCLNLIVIDQAEQKIASLRHVGSVERLADRFRVSFADALDKIAGFRRAWGFAVEDDVLAATRAAHGDVVPMKVSEALPGLFAGILERELVPVRGAKPEAVRRLVEAYSADDSAATRLPGGGPRAYLSRAAVVNAFTRYAHEAPQPDAFAADAIERAAGALLYPRGRASRPEPLPYAEPRG